MKKLKGSRESLFPKILSKNLNRRIELLDEAKSNIHLQNMLYDRCAVDIEFFFNYFLWTFNPKVKPNHFPFMLYPVQAELAKGYLDEIQNGYGSLTEKSREVGATYVCLGVHLHQFLFSDDFESLLLTMRADDVDNPTASSLFGKIRYMLDRLPYWLRPKDYNSRNHSKYMTLINPDNGNTIVGQATTEDAGRSGRKTAVLVDEYASISPRIIHGLETALMETTDCLQRLSTPKGINQFKAVRDRKICKVHTIHWTRIPSKLEGLYYINGDGKKKDIKPNHKNCISVYGFYQNPNGKVTKFRVRSKWYDQKCKDYLNPRDRAQELDINYLGSGFCRFDTTFLENASSDVRDGKRGRLEIKIDNKGNEEIIFVESKPEEPFELEVWRFPTVPLYYNRTAMGVDIAEGLEKGDYSSADVLQKDVWTDQIYHSASLWGHFTPDVLAEKVSILGRWYDNGHELIVERNKDGLGVLINLRDNENYKNLYRAEDGRDGFLTKQNNKFTITGDLDQALRDGDLVTHSVSHITELSTFENNNGKLGATGINHDDRVMSLALAYHLAMQFGRPKEQPITKKSGRVNIDRFDTTKY